MIQLKIKLLSENSFLVFVIDKIPNIKNDQELSDYLKNVFEIIKEKNQFDIYGYYDVLIYKDIILETVLTALFIISSWFINNMFCSIIYTCFYLIYVFIKRKDIKRTILLFKKILRK